VGVLGVASEIERGYLEKAAKAIGVTLSVFGATGAHIARGNSPAGVDTGSAGTLRGTRGKRLGGWYRGRSLSLKNFGKKNCFGDD